MERLSTVLLGTRQSTLRIIRRSAAGTAAPITLLPPGVPKRFGRGHWYFPVFSPAEPPSMV